MKYELSLKQKQKLILSPQLYQSINILQLNLFELKTLIDKELVENPLLETNQEKNLIAEKINREENFNNQSEKLDKSLEEEKFNDWLNYLKERDYQSYTDKSTSGKENKYDNFICYKESLQDYLLGQLGTTISNDTDYKIGEYLIGNINDDGYLTISLEDVSCDMNIKRNKIDRILNLIQGFDPPGVGARNLKECLLLQAKYSGINNKKIENIIKNYLPDLARKSYKKIARDLKITIFEVQSLADIIKGNFDPKPGRKIGSLKEVKYIIPDITIMKKLEGGYRVVLNDTYLPQIRVNYHYKKILNTNINFSFNERKRLSKRENISNLKIKDTKKYIGEKFNSAKWLIKSIEQRKRTIYRIAESLVDYQKDFLDKGVLYIKPLTLKKVADKLDIHESTVSRAIHDKIVQTPRGLLKMKFFFSKGVDNKKEGAISSDKIKKLIRENIDKENHLKPWSDQKITDLLSSKEGINISRRTVAKYREILKIPSSNLRKRFTN